MVMGDFNSMFSPSNKHNGEPVSSYETSDFRECCHALGLQDANYTGCQYSWTNGTVWSKLDRVLINPLWSSLHRQTHVHFDTPWAFTDHSPAKVCLSQHVQGRRNFKFFNMWASHDNFLDVVSTNWHSAIYGTPMFVLCRRLKLLKRHLKELNFLSYSHISKRVSRLETELANHQLDLQHDMDNQSLLEQEMILCSKLSSLKLHKSNSSARRLSANSLRTVIKARSSSMLY
jgi:hypothetical protein